jgi:DNA repair exonuclease SbcCD ATPase subunit
MRELEASTEHNLAELRGVLESKIEEARAGAEQLVAEAQHQAEARLAEAEARVEEERSRSAAEIERLTAELQAASQAGGGGGASSEELTAAVERAAALEARLNEMEAEAEQRTAAADARLVEVTREIEDRAASAEAKLAEVTRDLEERAVGAEAKLAEAERRIEELAAQDAGPGVEQLRVDNESLGTQIRDLLEEKSAFASDRERLEGELAALREELGAQGSKEEEHAKAIREERVRAEGMLEDMARLKMKVKSLENERDTMTSEVQRLTNELATKPAGAAPFVDDGTAVDELTSPVFTPASRSRDAVGREIETSLEEIEELITSAVPPPRR